MWGVGTPNALKTTIITTIMNPIKGNKKDEEKKIINEAAGEEYKYGFVTDVETAVIPKGLNEDVVRQISALKGEPEWLLEFRLKAFRHWLTLPQPKWGHVNIPDIDFQDISYYAAPRKRTPQKEIDPEVKKTFDKLGIPLEEQMRLSGMAVDAIMDSVSVHTTYREKLAELGVIFCSISEAVKDYPDLVKKYMGTVVPYTDNFYAALNSAVFSDGSFVYIPKGVRCPMELSSYFRINAAQTGQFERTLTKNGCTNIVWAWSPNLGSEKTVEAFLERYPGNDFVDLIGVDVYEFDNDDANYQTNLKNTLDVMMQANKKINRIPALTETGCRGISQKQNWFTQALWPVLQKYQLSYVLFWRNAWDKPQEEAYLPGVGDGAIVEDFKAFKKEKKVLFAKDIKKVK